MTEVNYVKQIASPPVQLLRSEFNSSINSSGASTRSCFNGTYMIVDPVVNGAMVSHLLNEIWRDRGR